MIIYYQAYYNYLCKDAKKIAKILTNFHKKGQIDLEVIRESNNISNVFCKAEVNDDHIVLKIDIDAIEDGMTYKNLIYQIAVVLNHAIARALDFKIRVQNTKDESLSRIQNSSWYDKDGKSYCKPLTYHQLFWHVFGE